MTVEQWNIDRPVPYARNARKIPQKAIDKVAASIREFGWKQPIVVDSEGVIVVGHTRLLAAKQLKLTTVPVLVATDLSQAQVKAYRLMDNRSHEETSWDFELLTVELGDLKGIDLELTGFDMPEIDKFLAPTAEEEEAANEAPLLPDNPVSRLGDLWVMGNHRLLCGDSTSAEDVARVLNGQKPGLMVTDPPYGVEYDPEWRNDAAEKGSIGYAARSVGKVRNDDRFDWSETYRKFPGDVLYIWHAGIFAGEVAISITLVDFQIRSQLMWGKPNFAISRGAYHWQHEPCWYAVRKGRTAKWKGDRSQSTLWSVATLDGQERTGHGTQKPVELFRRPMQNHDFPQVYEPFCGSGTAIIAAEQAGKSCLALELDPKYVDVIVKRWQTFTGKQALLEGGASFEAVQRDRAAVVA